MKNIFTKESKSGNFFHENDNIIEWLVMLPLITLILYILMYDKSKRFHFRQLPGILNLHIGKDWLTMTSFAPRDPQQDILLAPENSVFVIIDYQPTQITSIGRWTGIYWFKILLQPRS